MRPQSRPSLSPPFLCMLAPLCCPPSPSFPTEGSPKDEALEPNTASAFLRAPIYDLGVPAWPRWSRSFAESKDRARPASIQASEQDPPDAQGVGGTSSGRSSSALTRGRRSQVSRHANRPPVARLPRAGLRRLRRACTGMRAVGDDLAIISGFALLGDDKVLFVGHQKGKNLAERDRLQLRLCLTRRATASAAPEDADGGEVQAADRHLHRHPAVPTPGSRPRMQRPGSARDRREPDGDEPDRHADRHHRHRRKALRRGNSASAWATAWRCLSTSYLLGHQPRGYAPDPLEGGEAAPRGRRGGRR